MSYDQEKLTRDQYIWLNAWLATVQSTNSLETPNTYADYCLESFKDRFGIDD